MEINWNLLNPVDTGPQVQQGFATGMAMVKQVQSKNALRAYLANPQDEHAFSALSYYDPETANSIQRQQLLRDKLAKDTQAEALRRQIGAQAAGGDVAGARTAAIAGGDFDLAEALSKMDDASRKATLDKYVGAAPIAYQMSKLPYEQRKSYLQSTAPELKAMGWTDEQLQGFDPNDANLAGIIGTGSKLSELVAADKPQYVPLVPGGSVAAVGGGQASRLVVAPNPGDQTTGAPVVTQGGGSGSITVKNNPGALRKPGSMEFETFATPAAGIAAQESLLGRYINGGHDTVSSIVERYAPRKSRGGDNTDEQVNNYTAYVAKRLGIDPHAQLTPASIPQLAGAMREFETGHRSSAIAATGHSAAEIKAAAQRAIAQGADPEKVKARAAAQGVSI